MKGPVRALVAGATGVLGWRVVRELRRRGHHVVGAARSAANREKLRTLGAEPRDCDIFSEGSTTAAAAGCDAVLHLATAIPERGRRRSAWALNDRIRTEGTRALIAAAVAVRARLYLQQSVTFLYGHRSGERVDEDTPLPERQPGILESALEMERLVRDAVGRERLPAAILRCGAFYSADSHLTRTMVDSIREGGARTVGGAGPIFNLIHVEDAALAFADAVDRLDDPAGLVLNVVDDEPVPMRALFEHLAGELRAPPPGRAPRFAAHLYLGAAYRTLVASMRVSNERAVARLSWKPRYPTYREGFRQVLAELDAG
jgi:nucleoside-diphosphate-sugar epimerase